ncbi:hypothetical protein LEP1GSC036_1631 [Leptospira weilii str. 2006001853]|uniref:Uncharacterized protein n=3 Tax=Leptospira weilii TaxID=28184 RepID=A0A828YW54_9LEPT|nr:hypothetical protein LEP1GSC036_1631 [Leptospira weilii str. 2006001853]EMJ64602.1 hypothetical protein LEP1GSC051_2821 [Leptospira sp. P2653]EMN42645.1 hypothetical protein LEP1GSC086_1435 [Leptospira weilii str. LNT 1234]EMN90337.1 hypothetical protein LEP1GSC108_3534 [Leptospira weilii str. UI 13098]EMY12604.1 hypothetical protein LEP1GSC043_4024 [Leptospira weilii str. Ecochallenge]
MIFYFIETVELIQKIFSSVSERAHRNVTNRVFLRDTF